MAQTKQVVKCPYEKCGKMTSYAHVSIMMTGVGSAYEFDCQYCSQPIKVRISGKNGASVDQTPIPLKSFKKGK